MKITRYVEFIREARKRGFGDLTIRNELINKFDLSVNKVFQYLVNNNVYTNKTG
jgi:hypothetical protein